jgi:hypothetical protein
VRASPEPAQVGSFVPQGLPSVGILTSGASRGKSDTPADGTWSKHAAALPRPTTSTSHGVDVWLKFPEPISATSSRAFGRGLGAASKASGIGRFSVPVAHATRMVHMPSPRNSADHAHAPGRSGSAARLRQPMNAEMWRLGRPVKVRRACDRGVMDVDPRNGHPGRPWAASVAVVVAETCTSGEWARRAS